jgi:hypothetical protein
MNKTLVYTIKVAVAADELHQMEEGMDSFRGFGAAEIVDVELVNLPLEEVKLK